jgi:outer membrane biogenesis lipoprotein LolB
MKLFSIILVLALLFACSKPPDAVPDVAATPDIQKEEQYKKELDEIKKTITGDIRIKLKKDGKGDYSWEISGKNAGDVLKANDILNKKLNR